MPRFLIGLIVGTISGFFIGALFADFIARQIERLMKRPPAIVRHTARSNSPFRATQRARRRD